MGSHVTGSTMNVTMATTLKHVYVEIPFLFILIVAGAVGNVSIIGAVCGDRKLRSMGARLIANLAVVDLVSTCLYLPFVLANALQGYVNVLDHVTWLCDVTGFLWPLCCQAVALTLLAIAIDRFSKFKNPQSYKNCFTPATNYVIIAIIWVTSFLVVLPLITGWFGSAKLLTFDRDLLACSWDPTEPGPAIFLFTAAIFPPLLAILLYLVVFRRMRKRRRPIKEIASPDGSAIRSNQRIYAETSSYVDDVSSSSISQSVKPHHSRQNSINSHKTARLRRADQRERNFMTPLLAVATMRLLLWLPYGVMTLLEPTALTMRISSWAAFAGSAVNCVIYGILCRHFRRAYVTFYKKMPCFAACPSKERSTYDRSQSVKFG